MLHVPAGTDHPTGEVAAGNSSPAWRGVAKLLRGIALAAAGVGGTALFGLAVMLTISIVARKTAGWQVRGDVELIQMGGAVAVSLLFAWCQVCLGNIAVDFATKSLPGAVQSGLSRIGYFSLGFLGVLLAVRTAALGAASIESRATSILLAWPEGYWQLGMVPGLVLFGLVGLYQAVAPQDLVDEMARPYSPARN